MLGLTMAALESSAAETARNGRHSATKNKIRAPVARMGSNYSSATRLGDAKTRKQHHVAQKKNLRIARFLNRLVFCFFAEDMVQRTFYCSTRRGYVAY